MAHIQILVNNQSVDVPTDLDLSFKFENALFEFGSIPSQRTLEFDLPLTMKNNNIFGLPNNFAYGGGKICQKLKCTLIIGYIPLSGKIVIDGVSDGKLSCMFYLNSNGEAEFFEALENLPSLNSENVIPAWQFHWVQGTQKPLDGVSKRFCVYQYETDVEYNGTSWGYCPSFLLKEVIKVIAIGRGITVNFTSGYNFEDYGIVIKTNYQKYSFLQYREKISSCTGNAKFSYSEQEYDLPYPNADGSIASYNTDVYISKVNEYIRVDASLPVKGASASIGNISGMVESSYIIVSHGNAIKYAIPGDGGASYIMRCEVGDVISIVYRITYGSGYVYSYLSIIGGTIEGLATNEAITYKVESPYNNGNYPALGLESNLPDWNLADLLKIYAGVNFSPIYIKNGEVCFFDWTFEYAGNIQYENGVFQLISHDETYYQVGDCGQNAVVSFENDESNTPLGMKTDNKSLEEQTEVYSVDIQRGIPGSPAFGISKRLKIPGAIKVNNGVYSNDNDFTIWGYSSQKSQHTDHAIFLDEFGYTIENVREIFKLKTKIVITVFMRFEQFNAIKFNSYVMFRGYYWCVLAIDWSNNIGEMTLQRLSDYMFW